MTTRPAKKRQSSKAEPQAPQEVSRTLKGEDEFKTVARIFSIQSALSNADAEVKRLQAEHRALVTKLGVPVGARFAIDFDKNVVRWQETPTVPPNK